MRNNSFPTRRIRFCTPVDFKLRHHQSRVQLGSNTPNLLQLVSLSKTEGEQWET
jgi:hypothetical protein